MMPDQPLPAGATLRVRRELGMWFLPGSEVVVIADCREGGVLASGSRLSHGLTEGHAVGEVYEDEELCAWEEFEVPQ